MSSPIKPPGKPPGSPPPSESKTDASKASFDAALDEAAQAEGAGKAGGVVSSEALATLARDVAAGKIDPSEAVDRLVARALDGPTAAALPPARRAELEAHLRRALSDDPTLAALTQDLERGG
jgi:hypothetical protein